MDHWRSYVQNEGIMSGKPKTLNKMKLHLHIKELELIHSLKVNHKIHQLFKYLQSHGPASVKQIESAMHISQSDASQLLARLRKMDYVQFKWKAQMKYYSTKPDAIEKGIALLKSIKLQIAS